jgi:hypothetical protein
MKKKPPIKRPHREPPAVEPIVDEIEQAKPETEFDKYKAQKDALVARNQAHWTNDSPPKAKPKDNVVLVGAVLAILAIFGGYLIDTYTPPPEPAPIVEPTATGTPTDTPTETPTASETPTETPSASASPTPIQRHGVTFTCADGKASGLEGCEQR